MVPGGEGRGFCASADKAAVICPSPAVLATVTLASSALIYFKSGVALFIVASKLVAGVWVWVCVGVCDPFAYP